MNYVINFFISLLVSVAVVWGYTSYYRPCEKENFYVLDLKKVLKEQMSGISNVEDSEAVERYLTLNAVMLQKILNNYNGIILLKGGVVENGRVKDITGEVIQKLRFKGNGS
jgi:hypothetical protein